MSENNKDVMVVKNGSLPVMYTNAVNISSNVYDFQITFGQQGLDDDIIKITELCKIIMSPQHAKAFLRVLTQNIKGYEEKFGDILEEPVDIIEE